MHLLGDGLHVGGHDSGEVVPFSMFAVALMIGLLVTGKRIEFDGEEAKGDLGRIMRKRIAKIVVVKKGKWKCHEDARRSIM